MSHETSPTPTRRADIDRVFARLRSHFDQTAMADDPVAMVRRAMADYAGPDAAPMLPGTRVEPVIVDGVAAEWVFADGGSPDHRIVYCHGGGWIAGSPKLYRSLASVISHLAGVSVLTPDYRLAPENPLPAGLDDCCAAYDWAAANGPGGLVRPAASLALAGDSAGGALAVAACAQVIARGGRTPDPA